jgi:riboflavin kinase / FMN adenylyltransferase
MAISIAEVLPLPEVRHIAIGMFDGVHLGHRAILGQAVQGLHHPKESAVLTFEPHPLVVISPKLAPPRLTTEAQKSDLLLEAGVGSVVVIAFDSYLRNLNAEEFVAALHRIFPHLVEVFVGPDWRFGQERLGSVDTLRTLGLEHGFFTKTLSAIIDQGQPISSTRIREAINRRAFADADRLLGRAYTVVGTVVRGAGRGRDLGYPTANLEEVSQMLPPPGVYAGQIQVESTCYPAVLNYGTKPTVATEGALTLEGHLLGFSGDLYGKKLSVSHWQFIREEQSFATVDDLKMQIACDVASVERK